MFDYSSSTPRVAARLYSRRDPCSETTGYASPIWFFGRAREGLLCYKSRLSHLTPVTLP